MKTKLLSLAVAVLGTPILAHAVTPPGGFCQSASGAAFIAINAVLAFLGLPPISC